MKIRKRLLGLALCLCVLCGLPPVAAQAAVAPGSTQDAVIRGSSITAWKTGATSFNIRGIDGRKDYQTTFLDRGYETVVSVDTGTKQRNPSNLIAAGLRLDVDLELHTENYIMVQYTLTNSGARSHSVRLGGFADVMIDKNDHAPIYATEIGGDTLDMSGKPKNKYAFKLVATGSDTLWYGNYGHRYGNCFTDMTDRGPDNKYDGDSAVAYSWNATVAPGETWVRCVLIGIGSLSDMTKVTPTVPAPEELIPDPAISLSADEIYLTEGDGLPDWDSYIASAVGARTTKGAPADSGTPGTYTVTYTASSNNKTATATLTVHILPKPAELSKTTVAGTGDFTLSATMNYTGGLTWTETGFVYGVIEKPTLTQNDGTVKTGSAVSAKGGALSASVPKSSLVGGLQYYARAYAKASDGTVIYGGSSAYFGVDVPAYGTFSITNNGDNTFTITRTGGADGEQTVYYRTVNGSAVGGTHFTHKNGTLTFAAGDTEKTVTITETTANTAYSNKPATAYSNADRTYSVELYRVTGGADLGSTTSAARTMTNDTSYKVARDYYTRYRNFAPFPDEITRGDYDSDKLGWYKNGKIGSAASRTITVSVPNLNADYWKNTATGLSYFMQVDIKEVADGYQHIQITPGSSINTSFYPEGGNYKGFDNFDDMNPAAYAMTLEHGGSEKLEYYRTYSFPSGAKSGTVANARTPKNEYIKSGFSDGTGGLLFPVTQEQISIGYSASGTASDKWMEKEENHFIKMLDTREPQLVAIAPMAGGAYFPGDSVTISLIFDEIVDSTNSSLTTTSSTISTSWGTFRYAGGADTNVLYFTGAVPENASGTIQLTGLTCASQIKDMSDGSGTDSSYNGTKSTNVTVSKAAKPTVSVGAINNANGALSSTITATNAVKLEYAWSTSSTLPTSGWTTSSSKSSVAVKTARGAGTYYLHARATNSDGVTATAYKSVTIPSSGTGAAVSPELTVSVSNTAWATTRSITVTRSPSNAAVKVKAPDGSTATVSGNAYTAEANGVYTFTLTSGSETVTRQAVVSRIDTTAPAITINDLPNTSYTEQITLTFSVTDSGSGVNTVTAKWDTANAVLTQNEDGTYSAACPNATGIHTLTVTAADKVGNSANKTSKSYTINLNAPTLTVTQTTSSNKGVTYSYSVNANGNTGITVYLPDGTETAALTGSFTLTEPGTYPVIVTDAAGHFVSQDVTVAESVDGVAPDVRLYPNETTEGGLTVDVSVYETGSAPTVRKDGSALTVADKGSGIYMGSFTVTEGNTYTVTATDEAGNAGTASIIVYALVDGDSTVLKSADNGTYGELPTPTKTDYSFDGWYTAVEDGAKAETDTEVGSNYTLYARWTHSNHTNSAAVREKEIPATCTADGSYDEVVYCTVCKAEVSREAKTIDALGHDLVHHDAKASTCTETGWEAYDTCSREGCNYTTYKETPANGHTNGAAVRENEIPATCTEDGSYDEVVYCTVCKAEVSREAKTIDALGHDLVHHDAKAPTCTEKGWEAYDTCSREDCNYTTYKEIPANGHTWTDATCTTPRTCSTCKATEGNVLGHEWSEWVVTVPATEDADGVKTRTCRRNTSHTETATIPKLAHTHIFSCEEASDEYLKTAATCTTKAIYFKSCACGAKGTETFETGSVLGHIGGTATCTEKPVCTRCGQAYDNALGHDYVAEWSNDATGHWHACSRCDSKSGEAVHTAGDAATETTPQTCTVCGYVIQAALGHTHSWTPVSEIPSTCISTGTAAHYKCSCNQLAIEESGSYVYVNSDDTRLVTPTNADNHAGTPSDWQKDAGKHWKIYSCCHTVIAEAPHSGGTASCTVQAVCTVCGQPYGGLAEHTWMPATCTTPMICSACYTTEGSPLGHDFAGYQYDDAQHWKQCSRCETVSDQGVHSYDDDSDATCDICGYIHSIMPPHCHDLQVVAAIPATCASTGNIEHYRCTDCGKLFSDSNGTRELTAAGVAIDKLPHTPVIIPAVPATCEQSGLTEGSRCSVCQEVITEQTTIPALDHDWQPAACETPETCTRCHVTRGGALGHDYSVSLNNAVPATCTANGKQTDMKCSRCDDIQVGTATGALGHDWGRYTVATPATETSEGVETRTCARDSAHTQTRAIPKLPSRTYGVSGEVHENGGDPAKGVKVTLVLGDRQIASTTTNSDGKYSFTGVVPGIYNLVAEKGDVTMTVKVEVVSANVEVGTIAMPQGNTSSVVEVKSDDAAETVEAVVGNLEKVFEESGTDKPFTEADDSTVSNGGSVEIKLTVTKKDTDATSDKIKRQLSDDTNVGLRLELEVRKTVIPLNGTPTSTVVEDTDILLETIIRLPAALQGKDSYTVYRLHGTEVQKLTAARNANGEFIEVSSDKTTITIHARLYSEYVITYQESSGGNGGNGGGTGGSSYTPPTPSNVPDKTEENTGYRTCLKEGACPIWPFTDAVPSAWYHDGVHYCIENGLMQGVSTAKFLPDGSTTRAQLVTILWRLEGSPEATDTASFGDVADGAWYAKAVRWAAGSGVVKGYDNGSFGPDDAVTREQMVTILYRFAQYKGYDVSAGEDTNILSFGDVLTVSEYAIPAMQWACGSGMVNGIAQDGGMLLAPKDTTTRAQIATLMMRFQSAFTKVD